MKTVRRIGLLLLLSMTMPACGQTIEPEIYLLPAGFEGPVLIIFNQAEGAAPKYEGEARVYEIPASGVLWTQFSDQSGWVPKGYPKFYHVSADGSRTKIEYTRWEDTTDGGRVKAYGGSVGVSRHRYTNYVVCRRSELSKMEVRGRMQLDSVFGGFHRREYFEPQDSLEDARMGDAPK